MNKYIRPLSLIELRSLQEAVPLFEKEWEDYREYYKNIKNKDSDISYPALPDLKENKLRTIQAIDILCDYNGEYYGAIGYKNYIDVASLVIANTLDLEMGFYDDGIVKDLVFYNEDDERPVYFINYTIASIAINDVSNFYKFEKLFFDVMYKMDKLHFHPILMLINRSDSEFNSIRKSFKDFGIMDNIKDEKKIDKNSIPFNILERVEPLLFYAKDFLKISGLSFFLKVVDEDWISINKDIKEIERFLKHKYGDNFLNKENFSGIS